MEQTDHKDCFTRVQILVPHSDSRVFNMDRIQSIIDEILSMPRGSISDLKRSCTIATGTYGNTIVPSLDIDSHSATANPSTSVQVLRSSPGSNGNGVPGGHGIENRVLGADVGTNRMSRSNDDISSLSVPAVPRIGTQSHLSNPFNTRPMSARRDASSPRTNDPLLSSVTAVGHTKDNRVSESTTLQARTPDNHDGPRSRPSSTPAPPESFKVQGFMAPRPSVGYVYPFAEEEQASPRSESPAIDSHSSSLNQTATSTLGYTDRTNAANAGNLSKTGLYRTDDTIVNPSITSSQQPTGTNLIGATPSTSVETSTAIFAPSTGPAAQSSSTTISPHLATLRKCLKLALRIIENTNNASESRGSVTFGPQQCSELLLLLSNLAREIGCVMDEWKTEDFPSLDDGNGNSEQNLASVRDGMAHGVRVLDRFRSGGVGGRGDVGTETGGGDGASRLEELCLLLVILAQVIRDVGMVVDEWSQ